jgi:hypothetical protein
VRRPAPPGSGPEWSRTPAENTTNEGVFETGGAKSGALSVDLQQVVDRWSKLPPAIRAGILAMVNAV